MSPIRIKNKELEIIDINHNYADIIIQLCETKICNDCYFNKNKWFNLLQYLIKYGCQDDCLIIKDLTKFYLYGAEWFDYFGIRNNKLTVFNFRPNEILEPLINSSPYVMFKHYIIHTSVNKNIRQKLNTIMLYPHVYQDILITEDIADLQNNLPKGWADNLPKLNQYINNSTIYAKYFAKVNFVEKIYNTRIINKYVKKYGKVFIDILEQHVINLKDDENIENTVFVYLSRNSKLLTEPFSIGTNTKFLGGWRVIELITKLQFIDESAVQNHCIGRGDYYINAVKGGGLRAFSFRNKINGKETRYTVTYTKCKNTWEVEQDKGVNNRDKNLLYEPYLVKCLEINMDKLKEDLNKYEKEMQKENLCWF